MSEKQRTFIAVRFSPEVVGALGDLEEVLKRRLDTEAQIKWVAPDNIHLTLQFLGDVEMGLIPKLADGLRGAFLDVPPFEVQFAGVGAFPSPVKARVVWAGIQSGADGLRALQSCVHSVTEPLGYTPEDRPFRPHVTLGRVKHADRVAKLSKIFSEIDQSIPSPVGQCQIRMVHLVASELRPAGPVYSLLDSFPIGR